VIQKQTYSLSNILATLRLISHHSGQIIEANLTHLFDREDGLRFETENDRFHYWFVAALLCLYYPGCLLTGKHILILLIQDSVYRDGLINICPEFGLNTDSVVADHLLEAIFYSHILDTEPDSDLDWMNGIEQIIRVYQLYF
jgi:hypothetical protein